MKTTAALGLLQEIALVVWSLAAAWTVLPGGVPASAGVCAALALAAAGIGALAVVRRARRTGASRLPSRSAMLG